MDLLILALIAGFILYRLFAALGDKSGFDGDDLPKENGFDFETGQAQHQQPSPSPSATGSLEEIDPFLRPGIQNITRMDPNFSLREFIEGATLAFEILLEAFSKGDEATLKKFLAPELFHTFNEVITDRRKAGHIFDNTLVRIEDAVVEEAKLEGTTAQLLVKFTSEQIPVTRNQKGEIIEGNPNQIDQIIDYWTFERNLRSKDPNWTLIATQA